MDTPSVVSLVGTLAYQEESIVSRVLLKQAGGTVTLFAFDAGQELSEHSAPFEALLQVLEGNAQVSVGGTPHALGPHDLIRLPANVPHGVRATTRMMIVLVMLKE